MPVLFGPNNLKKFPESLDMLVAGVGFVIKEATQFAKHINTWNQHPEQLKQIGDKAKQFIVSQTGASQHIFDYLQFVKLL
jgi:3-deoxy-D-manno-octulosonic-acid transferase